MTTPCIRPILLTGPAVPDGALRLAGGQHHFAHVEVIARSGTAQVLAAPFSAALPVAALVAERPPLCGLTMDRPRLMGVLNVTPDSFSDGGLWQDPAKAAAHALDMVAEGADLIDIGGESTRPGAEVVPTEVEMARVLPVIAAIRAQSAVPISIDTRKAQVAGAAIAAGASLVNDVSALSFDPAMAQVVARAGVPLCLMHAQGVPQTMQADPRYDDVLLDVYDHLAACLSRAEAAGIPRTRLIVDPGIGFGKTIAHNLALLRRISLFHALGVPVLLGVSRKRFIGVIGNAPDVGERLPGSLAVGLAALAQGVQILRVHDTRATRQAMRLQAAVDGTGQDDAQAIWN